MSEQTPVWRAALQCLARRDFSESELRLKLKQKKFSADAIDETLSELKIRGYLNDKNYVDNYIAMRARKGSGPIRIRMELLERGIPQTLIAECLKIHDNAWDDVLHNLWKKHFKGKLPDNAKDKLKQMRYFQYRGFTLEQIEAVFKN